MWMQTKIRSAVRSDTQMSNRSPVLQIKPYQRFQINRTTTVNVNYIDQDDDIVRCEFSSFGTGNGIQTPYGLSMNKFYFEVVDHLNEPEFIDPTPPNSQLYEIYNGAAFTVNIFAKPTYKRSTTEIDQFLLTGSNGIHVDKSTVFKRPDLGPRGKPYFLHFPADTEIVCQVDSVCKFPLYASTENPGGIINILIIRKELFELKSEGQLQVKSNPTNTTQKTWMIEISFQDPRHGEKQFCAKAIDKIASIEQCTIIHVKPKDPCLSSPCQNYGECIAKKDGSAQCFCKHGATGERCQHHVQILVMIKTSVKTYNSKKRLNILSLTGPDPCYDKDFCKNGGQCIPGGYCYCPPRVTGMNCENVFSSCDQNVCPGHGMCIDTPGGKQDHECLCTNLQTGQQCSSCNMSPNPCNTGKCKMHNGSHTCICPEGFVGKDCQTAIDLTRGSLNSKFVSPTFAAGTVIKCDPLSGLIEESFTANCEFPVYVFWNGGLPSEKPLVEQKFISKDMTFDSHSKALLRFLKTSTTDGFNKTLTTLVRLINPDNQRFQIGMHVVCLVVKQGTAETDHRCFNIDVEDFMGDGRLFESPTLPGDSEIVCVKDKFCHINLYTEYKSNCKQPVFQSDAPCTVFGPVEMEFYSSDAGKVCHSDIAYSTGGLAVGTKRIFVFRQDPCSSNPCQSDGLCVALSDGTHSCICKSSCPATSSNQQYCQNDGHCHTDSIKKTCFCKLGSIGSQCKHKTTESLTNLATSGAKFIGSSLPTTIKCHLGDPCEIPSVLTGDPNVNLNEERFCGLQCQVQGIHVTQDKNTSHVYHTVTSILPKKTGNHKVCVQNVNAAGQTADELYLFNRSYSCPLVESNMKAPDGIFVFQSYTDPSPCSTDVSIHTDIERTITVCFTLKTPPEKMETVMARGPCSRLLCMNQGFCNGKGNIGFCQCPYGYSGTTCHVAHGNSLTAPHSQPGSKTGDHVLPKKVVCVLHEECSIPFTVTSSANPPSVRPGHTEAGLSSKGTTIIPDPNNPGTFLSQLNVVGNTPGVHKTCVQTGDNRETTSDEFCFEVEVKSPDSYNHEVKTSQPYFVTPTIPHDSVTQCVPGKSCHVLLFMSSGVYPECPSVEQTQGPTDDLHLFTSADNSKLIGNCTADVTLTPPSGSTGKYRFCFKTFIPNIPGEIRCFYVKYMDYSAPSPSCKGTSCQDGSVCDIINGQPTCICALLQSGQHCQQAGSAGTPHTSSQPRIIDLPLPKVIRCEVGTFCIIPTLVNADINNP
ncbi:unnamed protein product [Mytilus edulis]|uniref:EGF-like domain-containing protein n=1 Tax=Mytilus edulis TaxID=6550 RepID=A0A8S3TSX7_MYTED|nr:unnamed protein product [Mytilus edulis]